MRKNFSNVLWRYNKEPHSTGKRHDIFLKLLGKAESFDEWKKIELLSCRGESYQIRSIQEMKKLAQQGKCTQKDLDFILWCIESHERKSFISACLDTAEQCTQQDAVVDFRKSHHSKGKYWIEYKDKSRKFLKEKLDLLERY